jgi:hypothetical protein
MKFDFPTHRSGDTWSGINSITITSSGLPIDLTDCDVYIQFRPAYNLASPVVLTLTTENDTIQITDPAQGKIRIPSQIINIPVGLYRYDLQIDFPNNDSKTFLYGNFNIIPGITTPDFYVTSTVNSRYNSLLINNLIAVVSSNSAINWNYQGTDIKILTGNWNALYSLIQVNSSQWGLDTSVRLLTSLWNSTAFTVASLSSDWNSNFSTVCSLSDEWGYSGSALKSLSSVWEQTYYQVSSLSSDWNSVYSDVVSNSADWNYVYSSTVASSSDWDSVYSSVVATSADWNSVYSDVVANSADWNSVYSDVVANSADWNSVYSDVVANSADWNSVYSSTVATSADWNSVYSDVVANSADWNSVYSDVVATSADWNSVYSSTVATSADWNSVYSDVVANSADWDSVYSSTVATSADWNSVYSDVLANSADWNSVYSDVVANSADWNSVYSDVVANSADWNSVYSSTVATSADWNSVYSDVLANSADWNSVYSDVVATSADWNSVYSSTVATSADWNEAYSTILQNSGNWLSNNAITQEYFDDFITLGASSTLPHSLLYRAAIGGAVYVAPEDTKQGVLVLNTNPLSIPNQRSGVSSGLTIHLGQNTEYRLIFSARRDNNNFSPSVSGRFDMGFHDQIGTNNENPSHGCYFRSVNGGTWQAVTVTNAIPEQNTDTLIPCDTTWRTFEIHVNQNGTIVNFYINKILVASHQNSIPNQTGQQTAIGYRCFRQSPDPLNVELKLDWQFLSVKRASNLW